MRILHSEGIVLTLIPYKEADRILTLFTPDAGIVKLYVKGKKGEVPLMDPLTVAEFHYKQGKGDLASLCDATLKCQHLNLRKSYASLEAAEHCLLAILKTQLPGKAAPALYVLLRHILAKLPIALSPSSLHAAFLLKLLKYEGLLQLDARCSTCKTPLSSSCRYGGEVFCPAHAPPHALAFAEHEEHAVRQLAESLSLTFIDHSLPPSVYEGVKTLFSQTLLC